MIVRMVKVMVLGPLELLMETLTHIQHLGIMQVDEEIAVEVDEESQIKSPRLVDKDSALQHQFYEKIRRKIDELFTYLSPISTVSKDKNQIIKIDSLVSILPSHISEAKKRKESIERLEKQIVEHKAYNVFLDAVGKLADREITHDVQCLGVGNLNIRERKELEQFLEREYKSKAAFESVLDEEGKETICVVIVETEVMKNVEKALNDLKIPTFMVPDGLSTLSFSVQQDINITKIKEKEKRLSILKEEQDKFTRQWYDSYHQTAEWLESRLALIHITAAIVKSRMCFFIFGWLPRKDFQILDESLREKFQGKVVVEESELVERDFSRIPTVLSNPVYFEPFELFARFLPMPPYSSFDLTPFIGIFFPIFFGMMLGDAGYGVILLVIAVILIHRFEDRKNVKDAGKILFISSIYTVIFGILYGEYLGTFGHAFLGLKPLLFDRQSSVVPMLCFAVTAGVVHVLIGLVLGVIAAMRRKMRKEMALKLVNIFVILCVSILLVSYFTSSMVHVQKPLLLIIAILTTVVLVVGGLIAPLEMMKNIGNIISYARIMAVGLTSVLLAFVANYMAGRMGSIWAGIIVAVILHVFNLLLGVFAPTIHSLRLHYVEFLSKFMEPGGREFKPLGRKQ